MNYGEEEEGWGDESDEFEDEAPWPSKSRGSSSQYKACYAKESVLDGVVFEDSDDDVVEVVRPPATKPKKEKKEKVRQRFQILNDSTQPFNKSLCSPFSCSIRRKHLPRRPLRQKKIMP